MDCSNNEEVTLWVGGSSSLARTYVNQFGGDGLLLSGLKTTPPDWVSALSIDYVSCDLTTITNSKAKQLLQCISNGKKKRITNLIIGVRPILFAAYTKTMVPQKMLEGIKTLLYQARALGTIQFVLHISSVAAVDHLRAQRFVSENDEEHIMPPLTEYKAPYDIFKRNCEEAISHICCEKQQQANIIDVCHLRLSAIFSDDKKCIQCSALELQCRVGCYLPRPIDCNSSANVARAIQAIIQQVGQDTQKIKRVYYYTRPLLLERPVPYGFYLKVFRQAYGIENSSVWIPVWVVTWFVAIFHWLAGWNRYFHLPYLDAGDYLLQVASREHSFNCAEFGRDFPNVREKEESILECFVRRRAILEGETKYPTLASSNPSQNDKKK